MKETLLSTGIDIGTSTTQLVFSEITVENIRIVPVSNVSTVYITATDGSVYTGYLEADESLIRALQRRVGRRVFIARRAY